MADDLTALRAMLEVAREEIVIAPRDTLTLSASKLKEILDRLERAEAELAESRSMTREEYQRFYVESGRNAAVKKARNDSTRASAVNHRTPWTRKELDLALRTDIPASEVAKKLGRTEYAINHKRRNRTALDTGKETGE